MVKAGRHDPNGTAWSKSKTKIGFKLLEKMGWKEGEGLGREGDGVTEHVKVTRREETKGLGNGFECSSWKSNTHRFEDTLARLATEKEEAAAAAAEKKKKKKKVRARSGSVTSATSEASERVVTSHVYVPPSPKGSPKRGPLVATRRMYNRKLVKSKLEHKANETERLKIVGKIDKLADKRREEEEKRLEKSSIPTRKDNLTTMQRQADEDMSSYFDRMVWADTLHKQGVRWGCCCSCCCSC